MTDVDDWDDSWRYDAGPDPEPNCYTCNDGGYWIDYNKRKPLFGRPRRWRRCRGCNPTWWQRRTAPIRQWWRWRKVKPAPVSAHDPWKAEPPF